LTADETSVIVPGLSGEVRLPRKVSSLVGVGSVEPVATIVARAQAAGSDEERESILVDGLVAHGGGFPGEVAELDADLEEEAFSLLGRWLNGDVLTERADEAELRLRAGRELLEQVLGDPAPEIPPADDLRRLEGVTATLAERADPMILQLAAVPIACLPEGHPERDLVRALVYLLAAREGAMARDDREARLFPITALLEHNLIDAEEGEEWIEEGLELLDDADEEAQSVFFRAAEGFAQRQALDRRDAGDDEEAARWLRRAESLVATQFGEDADSAEALVSRAAEHDARNEFGPAADLYGRALAVTGLDDSTTWPIAVRRGELFLHLDEPEQAAEAIAPVLDGLAQSYITAVRPDQIDDAGDWLTKGAASLAVAHALAGRADAALEAIDRAKSLRLRYQAAVRQTPSARDLLTLERALDLARRGVDTDELRELAGGTETGVAHVQARVLEAYRHARPALPAELLGSPQSKELAELLEPNEALVALGLHFKGTLVVVASRSTISGAVFDAWKTRRWADLFTGREGEGWLGALLGHSWADRSSALADFLATVDDLGAEIAGLLPRGTRRLVLVAHALLHLVPFWALPSLSGLDVLVAPSAAQFAATRRLGPGRLDGRMLVVSNPTLDLPLSSLEATSVRKLGIETTELDGSAAVETAVAPALRSASALHFTGHGKSDFAEPLRSGLLVHSPEADPFEALLADGIAWNAVDDPAADEERWADIPGVGRVYETLEEDRLERRLEREESTLVAYYVADRLIRVGELWSAGDLMLGDTARGCAFAFLSACESGMGSGRFVDEYGGLPAALELAGARTLVSSMWPVSEPLTALYVELFYRELAAAGDGTIDVTAVVRSVRDRLSTMSRKNALELVSELRRATDGIAARLTLDSFAVEIGRRDDPPFTDPWELDAFYVSGHGSVTAGGAE
jgi:CHAT domain